VVEAELPGIDEKDISLDLKDGVLTIRGEKKQEYDEEKENYRVERFARWRLFSYASFPYPPGA
jgi:HSP20 family protein